MRNTNDKLAEIAYPQLQDDSFGSRVGFECADHNAQQQRGTVASIKALARLSVPPGKIKIVFDMVEP